MFFVKVPDIFIHPLRNSWFMGIIKRCKPLNPPFSVKFRNLLPVEFILYIPVMLVKVLPDLVKYVGWEDMAVCIDDGFFFNELLSVYHVFRPLFGKKLCSYFESLSVWISWG